ncbi:MAG TPA: hypothetical protein VN818_06485 [Gammaproteobacteria bacterium]|nr:hypothetical protein [Gammaproteobacteria bacterium]
MRAGKVVVVLARARKQRRKVFSEGQTGERGFSAARRDEQHMLEPVERGASRRK